MVVFAGKLLETEDTFNEDGEFEEEELDDEMDGDDDMLVSERRSTTGDGPAY